MDGEVTGICSGGRRTGERNWAEPDGGWWSTEKRREVRRCLCVVDGGDIVMNGGDGGGCEAGSWGLRVE